MKLWPLKFPQFRLPTASPPPAPQSSTGQLPTAGPLEDSFSRQRQQVEMFHQDYLPWDDRFKLWLVRAIAFAAPFVAVFAIGSSLGTFFAPAFGATASYPLAYTIEGVIAGLTVVLGMNMQNLDAEHQWKIITAIGVWLVLSLASGTGLYIMAIRELSGMQPGFASVAVGTRAGAVVLLDVGSAAILFFRGKSLNQHLREMGLKREALIKINEAEIAISRAQDDADMRRQEEARFLEARRRDYELVARLHELTTTAIIEAAKEGLFRGQIAPLDLPRSNGHQHTDEVFQDGQDH